MAPTCAEGGRCIVGDVGPGGGKIIYVNREIRISNIDSSLENYLTITTSAAHNLVTGDRISISGVVPAQLNIVSGNVTEATSETVFRVQTQLDRRGDTYLSGGVIPAAPGGWNYLQAAPRGWSGSDTDPIGTTPILADMSSNLLDWRVGSGDANTRFLRRQVQNIGQPDPFQVLTGFGAAWYVPSQMEIWAMFKEFAKDAPSAATAGFSSDYLSSSAGYYTVDYGHLWITANFSLNRTDNPNASLGGVFGLDGGHLRPVRKLWLHTAQTNVAVAKTLGIGEKVQIPSVTDEGTPVSIRVLKGSVCTVAAPAKKNRKTFFTLTGDKKAGTCSLRITAPETYQYWALNQTKTITVK